MTDRELMQMALNVLEKSLGHTWKAQKEIDSIKNALRDRLAQPEPDANCDQIDLYKMRWILASIYYHHEVRPDHYGSILEVLGYPTNDDLKKILGIK